MLLYNSIFSDKFFEDKKFDILTYLEKIPNLDQKIEDLLLWYKELQSGKVAQRSEEQQKSEFLDTIFAKVLGYECNENEWKIEKEFNFPNGAIADGLLGFFGVQKSPTVKVAIEIKKLKINLDKPQMQRADHFTPVEQGFHYAYQAKNTCTWVIVSNFEEIRLYNYADQNRYESFLFTELLQEKPSIDIIGNKNFNSLCHSEFAGATFRKNLTLLRQKNNKSDSCEMSHQQTQNDKIKDKSHDKIKDKKAFVTYIANRFPNLPKFFFLLHYGQLFAQKETDTIAVANTIKLYKHRMQRLDEITVKFYNEYKKYRKKLYEHLKSENKNLQLSDNEYINLSNKIFDRLIFMRFAEEVEILNKKFIGEYLQYIRNIPTDKPMAWHNIKGYFHSFDVGYKTQIPPFNGELFKPIPILDEIVIQNDVLVEIMLFLANYDFKNELKVDILGHIFEQSLNEFNPTPNPSPQGGEFTPSQQGRAGEGLRSRDGIFYTPEYITDFIIQETVTAYLNEHKALIYKQLEIDFISEFEIDLLRWSNPTPDPSPSGQGVPLPDLAEVKNPLPIGEGAGGGVTRKQAIEIHANFFAAYKIVLQNIKILDPACGSGAFLTRVFDYLLKENELVYKELEKFANNIYDEMLPTLTENTDKPNQKTNKTKQIKQTKQNKQVLQEKVNMFEVSETKNNKYQKEISLLGREILLNNLFGIDLNYESTEITKLSLWLKTANKYGVTLANLSNNIKVGNSLIADKNIDIKAFEWGNFTPPPAPPLLGGVSIYDAQKTPLPEGEGQGVGFDIIVGNPPYFSLSTQGESYTKYYQEHYQVFEKTSDIYCLFYEKALQVLKPNGRLGYITSNQWLQTNYGKILRNYLITKANPKLLVNFGGVKIFKDATVDSAILVLKNETCDFKMRACKIPNDFKMATENLKIYVETHELLLTDLQADRWIIADDKTLLQKEKIRNAGSYLKDWNVNIFRGLLTGLNEAFIIDEITKDKLILEDSRSAEILVPLLRGRDVHAYYTEFANLYLILAKNGTDIENYPAIFKHLSNFGEAIKNRSDQGENWWNLRACAYYDIFAEEKLIYPETTVRRSEFYLDKKGMYIDKTCFMITGSDLVFLQGILTSRLMEWYLESELRALGKNSIQYSKQYMENVPLPKRENIDAVLYAKIVEITEKLQDTRNLQGFKNLEGLAIAIEKLKTELDEAVFKLYGVDFL